MEDNGPEAHCHLKLGVGTQEDPRIARSDGGDSGETGAVAVRIKSVCRSQRREWWSDPH